MDMVDKKILIVKKSSGKSQGVKYIIEKLNAAKIEKAIIQLKKLL